MSTAIATDPAAEATSQRLHGCAFNSLNDNQQRAILALLDLPRFLKERANEERYCMTCGKGCSLQQCMNCREGQSDGYRPRNHSIV
jgi:hypothetical protein